MTEQKKSQSELYPWSILPPTASSLQYQMEAVGLRRAFQAVEQPLTPCQTPVYTADPLAQAIAKLATYKTEPPAVRLGTLAAPTWLQPALFWEFGLDTVLPYVHLANASKDMMQAPLAWQRLKGTPESVRLGLKWLNLNEIDFVWGEDEHFHAYQIELKGADSGQDPAQQASPLRQAGVVYDQCLQNMAEILKLSSPVRTQCTRVFRRPTKEVDRQPLNLSAANSHFGQILSDFDGVLHPRSGLRVSFHDAYVQAFTLYSAKDAAGAPTTANLAPSVQQTRYLTYHRDVQWQLQVPICKQHRHRAQILNRSSQCQWYGAWAAASWDAGRDVVGSRQHTRVATYVQARIQPQQQDAVIGADVQCLTWDMVISTANPCRTWAQTCIVPTQRQWYGGWQAARWDDAWDVIGSHHS